MKLVPIPGLGEGRHDGLSLRGFAARLYWSRGRAAASR